mgnify:CR=1 FL=1
MKSKFSIVTVKPDLRALTTAFTATDLLFDWTPIEIPRGGCSIETIQMHYAGTNGVAQTPKDIELIFAKSVNGVAPPTLGTSNGAITSTAVAQAARPHIIGYKHLDVSAMVDTGVDLVAYNLLGSFSAKPNVKMNIMLEGESAGYLSTKGPGYQTVWMAGLAIEGGEDFGAGVILDGAQAAAVGTQTQLTVTAGGVDPGLVFAKGDEVIAADGALVGTVVSIESNTLFTVDQVQVALADTDELCNKQPITFIFGLEY